MTPTPPSTPAALAAATPTPRDTLQVQDMCELAPLAYEVGRRMVKLDVVELGPIALRSAYSAAQRDLAARGAELATLRAMESSFRIQRDNYMRVLGELVGGGASIICEADPVDLVKGLRAQLQTATERAELERNMRITMETRDGDKLAAIVGLRSDLAALRAAKENAP